MWRILVCAAGLLGAANVWAGANDVIVDKVWMRESVPGQISVTVQMNLTVTRAARLLSVSSPVAKSGQIQAVVMRHGRLQTEVVGSLRLYEHSTTLFGTRGTYLSLVGLKQALNAGDHVPLTLVLEVGGKPLTINTQAEVRPLELSYQHYIDPTVKDHR
jgi:periplasmic copper chaperone A